MIWDHLTDDAGLGSLAMRARARRFAFFQCLLAEVPRPVRLLDVGGTPQYWENMGFVAEDVDVTILNLEPRGGSRMLEVRGDARHMGQFDDKEFDIVFSNSVIEHVGTRADQRAMANEVRRIGQRYFVQTPNYWFPLEPHFLVPGYQYLPVRARALLLQRFRLGYVPRQPDYPSAERLVRSIQLLSESQMRKLFPDARIHRERMVGLTKSLMAVGGWA